MAFKDMQVFLYGDSIKVNYTDKTHRYQAHERVNWELPKDNPKAWGKALYPKGCTTILGNTLEKKGLQRYPLTKALMYMFQFYEFTDDNGEKKIGYSKKGAGSFWEDPAKVDDPNGKMKQFTREEALDALSYGSKADLRWTQKGADIGSVVHDAIEHYVRASAGEEMEAFDIATQYKLSMETADYESDRAKQQAQDEADADIEMAKKAYERFVQWWEETKPELIGAEDLIYSKQHNICGTFDGLLRIKGKGVVLADWKTSNASQSKDAGMPEGVNYQYFLQSAIYAMAWMEMGREEVDDLLIVSCRKDGGFSPIFASDLGLTVKDCINWAKAVIVCLRMMDMTKSALWQHGIDNGAVIVKPKKGATK